MMDTIQPRSHAYCTCFHAYLPSFYVCGDNMARLCRKIRSTMYTAGELVITMHDAACIIG